MRGTIPRLAHGYMLFAHITEKSFKLFKASYATPGIVRIKIMRLLLGGHEDVWVTDKPRPQRCGAALWRTDDKEVRFPRHL